MVPKASQASVGKPTMPERAKKYVYEYVST